MDDRFEYILRGKDHMELADELEGLIKSGHEVPLGWVPVVRDAEGYLCAFIIVPRNEAYVKAGQRIEANIQTEKKIKQEIQRWLRDNDTGLPTRVKDRLLYNVPTVREYLEDRLGEDFIALDTQRYLELIASGEVSIYMLGEIGRRQLLQAVKKYPLNE